MPQAAPRTDAKPQRRGIGAAAALVLSVAACGPVPRTGEAVFAFPLPYDEISAPAAAPRLQEAALTAPRPAITPGMLTGMAAADLQGLLGVPSFRRHEATAEIWQYFGPGCVLDIFLYEDGGSRRVVHHQLRSQVAGRAPEAACLDALLGGSRGQRLG